VSSTVRVQVAVSATADSKVLHIRVRNRMRILPLRRHSLSLCQRGLVGRFGSASCGVYFVLTWGAWYAGLRSGAHSWRATLQVELNLLPIFLNQGDRHVLVIGWSLFFDHLIVWGAKERLPSRSLPRRRKPRIVSITLRMITVIARILQLRGLISWPTTIIAKSTINSQYLKIHQVLWIVFCFVVQKVVDFGVFGFGFGFLWLIRVVFFVKYHAAALLFHKVWHYSPRALVFCNLADLARNHLLFSRPRSPSILRTYTRSEPINPHDSVDVLRRRTDFDVWVVLVCL